MPTPCAARARGMFLRTREPRVFAQRAVAENTTAGREVVWHASRALGPFFIFSVSHLLLR